MNGLLELFVFGLGYHGDDCTERDRRGSDRVDGKGSIGSDATVFKLIYRELV